MADAGSEKPTSSLVPTIIALVASIGIGAGGALVIDQLADKPAAEPAAADKEEHAPPQKADGAHTLTDLPALLTNLAPPGDTWVRLEASLLSMRHVDEETVADIQRDVLAYLRTVHLSQVEGPTGYLDLRDALEERARLHTSDKHVRLLVRTLLFE